MMDFPGHFQNIFQQLNLQRLHAQLCDCVVEVGGHKFHAHRAILAAGSSHFKALLGSGEDAGGGGPGVMVIDPEVVTPEAFSTLLDMIYTSTLSLGASNVMDVLLAASHLHLNAVVKACKLHLSRKNFPTSAPKGWRSVEVLDEGGVVVVSQSGDESSKHKRKPHEERLGDRKRTCGMPGDEDEVINEEAKIWEGRPDEVEEKYGATMSLDMEEIQLPSQSDSSASGVKVKLGEEGGGEPKMETVEVKKETMTTSSSDRSLAEDCGDLQEQISSLAGGDVGGLQTHLCSDLAGRDAGFEDEGIDSLSELALSCFLNPGHEGETAAMDQEEGFASLAAAATAAAAASDAAGQRGPNTSAQAPDATLLLTSVPLEQILPTQSPGFSDTLILRPAHNSLTGFLSLEAPKGRAASSGTTFRRIAPKVLPESDADPSAALSSAALSSAALSSAALSSAALSSAALSSAALSSAALSSAALSSAALSSATLSSAALSSGPAADDRAPLTRASEDVLSKCKKAAAEDNVLLVEGEKKYACKICSKTFMNLTDCKKHIRVHTGEKPYPCPKCGKRFSQSSHLYKHSKNSSCVNWKDEHSFPDALP
ncbi:zinc finger and BTB domain-containing protein 5-like [Entelurus aequoreus]|uniref:zinc finger and BTB domain-containing protein 5-like n=1 Tax=Entelurus aequoreus TaxID=161455 RepID=UPI002B1D2FD3|nr:zinc finger and BTB domain-containing protein 5-like [Entelurus aequoreus]